MLLNLPREQTVYLIDISSFIFRAFFAIRALKSPSGEPTNAIYGVATMMARLLEEANPHYLAVMYDSQEPCFREKIYSEYKANRSEPPEDLVPQFAQIDQLISVLRMHSYRVPGMEADDLIATITHKWCDADPNNRVVIVTGDKDLMQLVSNRVSIWDTMASKVYSPKEVEEKFKVKPEQIRDYLGLIGDSSDNIPGVPGIGPKTASDLLHQYSNLENVLLAAREGKIVGKKGDVLLSHEKDARLSAHLVTLKEDIEIECHKEDFAYQFQVTPDCIKFLERLGFHSLLKKWMSQVQVETLPSSKPSFTDNGQGEFNLNQSQAKLEISLNPDRFRVIDTEEKFQELIKKLEETKKFGFDLETTSLNPRHAEIVGLSFCYDSSFGVYIPIGHTGSAQIGHQQLDKKNVLEKLKPILENENYKKIGQNLKYDWSVLRCLGFNPQGLFADTMVAGYLIEPEERHNLQALAEKYLNYTVLSYEELCGKGADQIGFNEVAIDLATRYSAEDAWLVIQLWEKLEKILIQENLIKVFEEIDMPLVSILSSMELQGVCIDVDWFKKLSEEFGKTISQLEKQIQTFTNGPINLNSPKQISQLLFEELKLPSQGKTKTGYSTDAQVLDILAPLHEVPRLLLEYRELAKLKGTYVDPLPELLDNKTNKIHASFHQTVTATGRLSSSDPNLQNIPIRSEKGLKIRKGFIPSLGCILLSADYSQIELRLLAHMSGDTELIRSFQKDEDVHRRTASELFQISPEEINDEQRSIAKAINFGLMYGKSAFGLSQELKIPRKTAQLMIEQYFQRYSRVKEFLNQLIVEAQTHSYVMTLSGRKRHLSAIHSKNHGMRSNAERMAMNTPIQGTAADLMKLAMIKMNQALDEQKLSSKMIIQVHDEILLDCALEELDEVKELVKKSMENAMTFSVPLKVNLSTGMDWMSL